MIECAIIFSLPDAFQKAIKREKRQTASRRDVMWWQAKWFDRNDSSRVHKWVSSFYDKNSPRPGIKKLFPDFGSLSSCRIKKYCGRTDGLCRIGPYIVATTSSDVTSITFKRGPRSVGGEVNIKRLIKCNPLGVKEHFFNICSRFFVVIICFLCQNPKRWRSIYCRCASC